MEVLDLNSENEAEKKGIADDIYLNKNADTGLAAPLLEPSHNEGVIPSEDSNKEESKYVVIDIVQESEEVDPLIRCCSCFSFFFPSGSRFNLFRIFGKKHEEDSQKPSLAEEPWNQNSGPIVNEDYPETTTNSCGYAPRPSECDCDCDGDGDGFGDDLINEFNGDGDGFGDDLINEFNRPVKHVDLPRPKGS